MSRNEANIRPSVGVLGWKMATAVLAVLLAASLLIQVFGSRAGDSEAVAVVNGVEITKDDLYDAWMSRGGADALDELIREEVIRQGIAEAGTSASDGEVQARMEKYAEPYGSMEAFLDELAFYGYAEEEIRKQLAKQISIEKIVGTDVEVTDEEIAEYFELYRTSFDRPETVRASHILVETREEAESLLARLEAGEDFALLAAEYSLDEATRGFGGDVGVFARGEMEERFEEAAFGLAVGGTAIAETGYGFHVVRVTDKTTARKATLESARGEIAAYLKEQKVADRVDAWIAAREAEAEIVKLAE